MPHSSGGGSSSGSSHSGGGSSHSGGSGQSFRTSKEYFPGSRRYIRRDGSYYYSNGGKYGGAVVPLIVGGMFLFTSLTALPDLFFTKNQSKLPDVMYNDEIVIDDKQDLISDADEAILESELNDFLKNTNISVAVETVDPSEVTSTLENYAYDSYVSRFSDEYHWLIVFSSRNSDETIYFEGMQGDETDPVLTEKVTTKFNKDVAEKLKETRSVKESLSHGLQSMKLKDGFELNTIEPSALISLLFPIVGLVTFIQGIKAVIGGLGAKEG